MCDTQVLIRDGAVWFAKNSDREPSEPQSVVRYAAAEDRRATLRVSHIDIAQVPRPYATILSQPAWCWGAEMGVNEAGVAIGNEAIFSRHASLKPALLGMDLVRLGLERADSAATAVEVMTSLLERYGQGGPAGYQDRGFCYDNSFLIADPHGAWVLETAGRRWVAKRVESAYAISNALTLEADYSLRSADLGDEAVNFARRFDRRLMPWLAASKERRALAERCLSAPGPVDFARMAAHLRMHRHDGSDPAQGSNADVCMHAAGFIRRHQTTGSMIARLSPQRISALFTGSSAPCLSIFRPAGFSGDWSVLTPESQRVEASLWRRQEWLHRWALADPRLRERLRSTREVIEPQIFELVTPDSITPEAAQRADRLAASWHKVLWESLSGLSPPRLPRHWRRIAAIDGIAPNRHGANR